MNGLRRGMGSCVEAAVLFAAAHGALGCGNTTSSVASGGAGGADGGGGAGHCVPPLELACNGACLQRLGQEAAGCKEVSEDVAYGMSIASGFLYYSGATSIDRLDLASLETLKLTEVPALPMDVVVDSSAVYFDTQLTEPAVGSDEHAGTLRKVAPTGGNFTVLASGLSTPFQLTLVGSTFYFASGASGRFNLMTDPLDGTSAASLQVRDISAYAIDGATLYTTPSAAQNAYRTELHSAALTDPTQTTVLAKLDVDASWLSADASYVFFLGTTADASGAALKTSYGRVAKADGTAETLRTSATPFAVKVAEADTVYLLELADTGDRLLKMPRGGGAEQVLATLHDTHDRPVAIDATFVYVGTDAGIVRLAK